MKKLMASAKSFSMGSILYQLQHKCEGYLFFYFVLKEVESIVHLTRQCLDSQQATGHLICNKKLNETKFRPRKMTIAPYNLMMMI